MNHTTPTEEIFNEIKEASKTIWNTYDNTYGYATEKIERVESITNFADNVMTCYRMFDSQNQSKMRGLLSIDALEYIKNNL